MTGGIDLGGTSLKRVFAKDLDGSLGIEGSDLLLVSERAISASNARSADVWLFARERVIGTGSGSATRPAVWRRVLSDLRARYPDTLQEVGAVGDTRGFPGGQMDAERFELVDVNGDRLLDLLTCERLLDPVPPHNPSPDAYFNYVSSSLSGVAGRLQLMGIQGASRSALPGTLDINLDGYTDVVTGGQIWRARRDGSHGPVGGLSLPQGTTLRHRIEKLDLSGDPSTCECVVSDESVPDEPNSARNRIYRIRGLYGPDSGLGVDDLFGYSFGGSGVVREIRALTAPDTEVRQVKDLVGLVGTTSVGSVRRARIDNSTSPPTVTSSQLWPGSIAVEQGIALVRRQPLTSGPARVYDVNVQDVVVVDSADRSRLIVLRSDNSYLPRVKFFPGETIVRIAEASVTSDDLEDLVVLTLQDGVYRIRVLAQDPAPSTGLNTTPIEAGRFAAPFPGSAVRSFQFDRDALRLCQGFLLIGDTSAANMRSEVRLLRPSGDGGNLIMRMVRSPLNERIDQSFEVVVRDADKDQIIEVIGGQRSGATPLQRVQTNVSSGQ